jgi:hypothetical protein
MLGSFGLGVTFKEAVGTAGRAIQTTDDILPAVKVMANDYQKASPAVNWLIDHWPVALVVVALTVAGGAFGGSYVASRGRR